MKRITTFIVTIMMVLLCFSSAFAADSPTVRALYRSNPALKFEVVRNNDINATIYDGVNQVYDIEGLVESALVSDNYSYVELLVVDVNRQYNVVTWWLPEGFKTSQNVCVLMVRVDMGIAYMLGAEVNPDSSITLNYTEVQPDRYYMFVFVSDF